MSVLRGHSPNFSFFLQLLRWLCLTIQGWIASQKAEYLLRALVFWFLSGACILNLKACLFSLDLSLGTLRANSQLVSTLDGVLDPIPNHDAFQ